MSHSFCRLLSNGYSFGLHRDNSLVVGPCCLFQKKIPVDQDLLTNRKKVFEIITGWTDDCGHCYHLEQANQQSLRQTGPDWIPDRVPSQSAIMVDINLDKECNAACVMCNEKSSTLWMKEKNKFQGIKLKLEKSTDLVNDHIERIVSLVPLDQMTYLKFVGGEPLFTDTHLKVLSQLPNPQNITVHYTTNGSIFPSQEVLDIWARFKTIIFAASIDGIDQQFNYIRWPLSWQKVSNNLIRLKQHGLHNLMFRVEFTANILNVFYYDLLEQWVKKNWRDNIFGDITEINVHPAAESAFNLNDMPLALRHKIQEKYPADHRLHLMVKNLNTKPDTTKFQQFVSQWDPHRELYWHDCFPDLTPYFNK